MTLCSPETAANPESELAAFPVDAQETAGELGRRTGEDDQTQHHHEREDEAQIEDLQGIHQQQHDGADREGGQGVGPPAEERCQQVDA